MFADPNRQKSLRLRDSTPSAISNQLSAKNILGQQVRLTADSSIRKSLISGWTLVGPTVPGRLMSFGMNESG
jgi:hypothetical protein